jgi:methylmalonyl-CoA mutase N-terminal domain/subunit
MEYAATAMPRYNPVSVSGYHIRDADPRRSSERAFTLAAGHCYVTGPSSGGSVHFVAPRVSFF